MKWLPLSLAIVSALSAKAAWAYDPPPGEARTNFLGALIVCQPYLKNHKSPGEVSEADYLNYVEKRDKGLAADTALKTWDKPSLGIVPKDLFPQCEKLMADYAAGVDAEKKPTLSNSCKNNVESRLNSIMNTYYPEFKKSGANRKGQAWFARKDLEAARFYMYQRDGWLMDGGACAHNDPYKRAFAPLKELFAKAEALVQQIEKARGVRFEKVETTGRASHVVFIDLATQKPVAKSDEY